MIYLKSTIEQRDMPAIRAHNIQIEIHRRQHIHTIRQLKHKLIETAHGRIHISPHRFRTRPAIRTSRMHIANQILVDVALCEATSGFDFEPGDVVHAEEGGVGGRGRGVRLALQHALARLRQQDVAHL